MVGVVTEYMRRFGVMFGYGLGVLTEYVVASCVAECCGCGKMIRLTVIIVSLLCDCFKIITPGPSLF